MKAFLRRVLPNGLIAAAVGLRGVFDWIGRGCLGPAPQWVKQNVLVAYGVPEASWIETGTYLGVTTDFLARRYPRVFTIEPSKDLCAEASRRLAGRNVEIFNDVSENILPELLPRLAGACNFWLDGHYSAGITFKGDKECPVEDELRAIEDNLTHLGDVAILIDDARCFVGGGQEKSTYPPLDDLVAWAARNGFAWTIEHDIFIMRRSGKSGLASAPQLSPAAATGPRTASGKLKMTI